MTAEDDRGRPIALAHAPARIVSLAPSSTELLFAIGAGDRVVGRTTWCRYPAAALAVPAVGDGINPNVEAVLARQPDLVLVYDSPQNVTAADQLARLGVPTAILRQDLLEDVARDARLLGRLTGLARGADSVAGLLDSLTRAPPPPVTRRVAFVAWDSPPIVIGAGSYLTELARAAGARNVFDDIAAASATVALETIAARDPDVIITIADSAASTPGYATRREWQAILAVREHRFLVLPGDLYGRPSPRAAEAVRDLRARLAALK